ncbi:putative ribonuclease H-like domain-containing protein [Tanacetum coccineum]
MCTEFEKMMPKKFQMSSMGELTFFLGLQVKQKEDRIFISQDKYVNEILNKFCFSDVKIARTPIETQKALLKDADSEDVDEHLYRSMIGSLMYLTSSRHDIMFAVYKEIHNRRLSVPKVQVDFIAIAKTTAWNEFSSTMASAIICLATNQKFNFSKYIFDNMVKNLEGRVKFLMYPRFMQVFVDKQVEGMSKYKKIYVTPSHTKKVFANIKRQGKDFSGRDTPFFPTMIVQAQEQSRRKQRKDTKNPQFSGPTEPVTDDTENMASVPKHSNDPLLSEITELKKRVKNLEGKRKLKPPGMKRLFKIGRSAQVVSSEDEGLGT